MGTSQSQPKKRRAVITGLGAVTPLGDGLDGTIERIARGTSAVSSVRRFDASGCGTTRAAEIDDLDARRFFRTPKSVKLTDRRTQYAVAAASMALSDAGLQPGRFDAARAGVIIGTSGSDLQVEDLGKALGGSDCEDIAAFGQRILSGLNPLWLLVNLPNMVSAHVSIQFDLQGPNSTVMTDWIAGVQAIGEAASWIEQGEADVVVCGGADCGVLPFVFADYEGGPPFSQSEDGVVAGDGAALFVLEEREHALARDARIYGEVAACAVAAPPSADGENSLALAMEQALDRAAWSAEDVSVVSPAWIPHRLYDQYERAAADAVFRSTPPPRIESNRRALGFSLAAASTIDIAIQLRQPRHRGEKLIANSLGYGRQAASVCIAREGSS